VFGVAPILRGMCRIFVVWNRAGFLPKEAMAFSEESSARRHSHLYGFDDPNPVAVDFAGTLPTIKSGFAGTIWLCYSALNVVQEPLNAFLLWPEADDWILKQGSQVVHALAGIPLDWQIHQTSRGRPRMIRDKTTGENRLARSHNDYFSPDGIREWCS